MEHNYTKVYPYSLWDGCTDRQKDRQYKDRCVCVCITWEKITLKKFT